MNQYNFNTNVKNKLNNKNFYHYDGDIITKPEKNRSFYLINRFKTKGFIDKFEEKETVKIILYITLVLLDSLNKGIFYKLKLDPNYSFKIYEYKKEKVNILGFNFKTTFFPVFNLLVTKYDHNIENHDDYYKGTIIDKQEEFMRSVIVNNVKNMDIDSKILRECIHETNVDKFINMLYFYSCKEYSINDEVFKFNIYSKISMYLDIEQKLNIGETYKGLNNEFIFNLLIRWQYNRNKEVDMDLFIEEMNTMTEDNRKNLNFLRRFYQ